MSILTALAIMQAASAVSLYEPITQVEAERRLTDCTVSQFDVIYEEEVYTSLVSISDDDLSDVQLACLAYAFDRTGYFLHIPEDRMGAFFELEQAIEAPRQRAAGLAWFAERGMAEQVAVIDFAALADDEFAAELEGLCGPLVAGAFSTEYGTLTFAPEWMQQGNLQSEEWMEAMTCIMNGYRVSGRTLWSIGNEKYPDAE